ncbi:MAG: hypothetical protein SNJ72_00640 [Fimbriimonadales bacterium]
MRNRRWTERALSLFEILVVVAIIALLVALLLPVVHQARKRSHTSSCISNLRQLVVAATMYRNDYGEYPLHLQVMTSYVKDPRIWICPSEPMPQDPQKVGEAVPPPHMPQRIITPYYFYTDISANLSTRVRRRLHHEPRLWVVYAARRLREADPNHGLFACVLHGEFKPLIPRRPYITHLEYQGLTLRALQDGSVQRVQTQRRLYSDGSTSVRDLWPMFTDAPCPPEFCHEEDY